MKKKTFKWIGLGFIGIVLAAFIILTFSLDYIVKYNLENIGFELTQTPVTVDNVNVSLFSGQGTIEGLKVKNPEGFTTENALTVEEIRLEIGLSSLWSDTIRVREAVVRGPGLNFEENSARINLRALLNNMEKSISAGSESQTAMVISYLLVEEGSVHLKSSLAGKEADFTLEKIEQRDIGRGGNSTVKQTVEKVLRKILQEAMAEAAGDVNIGEKLKDAVKDIFN